MRLLVTFSKLVERLYQLVLQCRKPRLHFDYTHTSYIPDPQNMAESLSQVVLLLPSWLLRILQHAPAPSQTHSDTPTFSFNHTLFPPLTCTHSDTFTFGYISNSWHSHSVMFGVLHPHLITITPSHSPFSYTTNVALIPPHSIIITCD